MATPHQAIRLGIIGCGRAAQRIHLPVLQRLPHFRVVAAADVNPDNLTRTATRFGIERCFNGYEAVMALADVEAVAVLTPTASHAEIGLAALKREKHLFIEKPLALNLNECELLMGQADHSGVKILVGLNFRWHRLLQRAPAMLRSGKLGHVKAIRSVYTHWSPGEKAPAFHKKRELGAGVLFNDGVHHFDLWRFLLASEVTQLYSQSMPSEHYDDETSTVHARMANGVLATGVFSFETSANSELEIFGTNGRLQINCYRFDGLEFFSHLAYAGSLGNRLRLFANTLRHFREALPIICGGGDFQAAFEAMWRHFADCIRYDKPTASTLEDGKRALQIALAAIKSASSDNVVHLM